MAVPCCDRPRLASHVLAPGQKLILLGKIFCQRYPWTLETLTGGPGRNYRQFLELLIPARFGIVFQFRIRHDSRGNTQLSQGRTTMVLKIAEVVMVATSLLLMLLVIGHVLTGKWFLPF
jgi:hypothetical protein